MFVIRKERANAKVPTTSDHETFPKTLRFHAVGTAVFVAGPYGLGLTIRDVCSCLPKLLGAAIFWTGCDELVCGGGRSWR